MEKTPLPTSPLTKTCPRSNILIVDDEPRILRQIENDLFGEGFFLITANSAEEGLKILRRQDIHVIVCDQKMPGGMCGTHFLYEVRKQNPSIVGLMLSAYSEPEILLNAMNKAKAFHYLCKPWKKQELVDILSQALKAYQLNLLTESLRRSNILSYDFEYIIKASKELAQTSSSLKEAILALSSVSEFSSKMSGVLKRQLEAIYE